MSELKRCPFCGGEEITIQDHLQGKCKSFGMWFVQCDNENCLATFPFEDTKEEVIKRWNNRVPMRNIVERLEEEKSVAGGHEIAVFGARCAYEIAIEIVKEEGGV